jgi:hypothetical protein
MITARQILEEFKTSLTTDLGYCEVLKDPSRSELKSLGNYIRFTADGKNKTLYVWAYDKGLHRNVLPALGLLNRTNMASCINGTAQNIGGTYGMIGSDSLESMASASGAVRRICDSLLALDWSWTKKYYVELDRYLNSLRNY